MSLLAELREAIYDLPLARKPGRDEVAHFCEHQGIRRSFIRARTTWQAMTPSTVKPWWIILNPMKNRLKTEKLQHNKKIIKEVLDDA